MTTPCSHCAPPPDRVNHVTGHIFVGWGHGWQPCRHCNGSGEKSDLQTDFTPIADQKGRHPAYASFVEKMCGHAYGREELLTAWSWYRSGWVACHNDQAPTSAHEMVDE